MSFYSYISYFISRKRKTFCSFIKTYHIGEKRIEKENSCATQRLICYVNRSEERFENISFLKLQMANQIYLKRVGFDMNLTKLLCYYADG